MPSATSRVAIIDIGSNSMRMVVYDGLKRAPVSLYNEKVMCQLGLGLASTGRLNPGGMALAHDAMRRFLALSSHIGAESVHVMATAAVRDAEDGAEFARKLEKDYGISIDIISGEREARLGAYGVCASFHLPSGLTGDLGGGSMELVQLEGARFGAQTTLPIGPLRLLDITKGDRDALRKAVSKAFNAQSEWLSACKPDTFFAIGGTFRAIAHVHMAMKKYPLHILHQYTVSRTELAPFVKELASLPEDKLKKLPELPGKRVPSIPPAAIILNYILETAAPARITFSAAGIREGYLYEMLDEESRNEDALLASCTELARRGGRSDAYAHELHEWMAPVALHESPAEARLRRAFSLLTEIGHHIHPEYRAEWACERVLYSSFAGLTHAERVQLAMALYHRYQFKLKFSPAAYSLIGAKQRSWAQLMGSAANLAYHITGGQPGTLPLTALEPDAQGIALHLSDKARALAGEAVRKRVGGLQQAWLDYLKLKEKNTKEGS